MFNTLHVMFETQYNEQWMALDETAERMRALGFNAPGSYARVHPPLLDPRGARPDRDAGLA